MVSDFNKKQKRELFKGNPLFKFLAIFFVAVIVLLIVSDVRIYLKKKELRSQINNYQQQIEELKKKNQTLKMEISNADNPDYIEKVAREEQDMQKPGENVVAFVMPEKKQEEQPLSQKQNLWEQWVNWFKGKF